MLEVDNGESELELEEGAKNIVDELYNMFGEYIAIALDNNKIIKSRGNLINEKKVSSILEESQNKKSLLMITKIDKKYKYDESHRRIGM